MKKTLGEKGAISIWSTLMIMTFIIVFFMLYSVLHRHSLKNEMIRRVDLSSKWVLSHYNETLLKEYGIMGYSREWLNKPTVMTNNLEGSECAMTPLSHLGQPMVFVEQAVKCTGLDVVEGLAAHQMNESDYSKEQNTTSATTDPSDDWHFETELSSEGISHEERKRARRLSATVKKNKKMTDQDLSEGLALESKKEMPDVFDKKIQTRAQTSMKPLTTLQTVAFHEYLISHFQSYVQDKRSERLGVTPKTDERPFSQGEMEFILHGKRNRQTNQLLTWGEILAMRIGVNTTHLLFCGAHQKQMNAMASLTCAVFPIAQPAAYVGLLGAWATMESYQDLKHLKRGKEIPTVKTSDDEWLTDFENAIQNKNSYGRIHPMNTSYYSDYVRMMLWLRPLEVKTTRAMGLIEWHMSQKAGTDFHLEHWMTRHRMKVTWRGMTWELEDGY